MSGKTGKSGMRRRDAIKTLGALAGASTVGRALPGCGDNAAGGPDLPDGLTTLVVLMMENRSYDHLLGARAFEGKPGDGLTMAMRNPDAAGNLIAPYPGTFDSLCVIDPPHGWGAAHDSFAGGANDGFVRAHQAAHSSSSSVEPMQYLTRDLVPATWALADQYAVCDRWFCSVMGPTWPNRMYWHSGSSNGISSNDLPTDGFNWDHIYQRLDAKGVPWAYYYGNIPAVALIENFEAGDRIRLMDKFFLDARDGVLPPVVYIDPMFYGNDDHPPVHPLLGQQLIASIYIALATSPQWKNCMFVITYDENGGFFDHVPPPTTSDDFAAMGFGQMGFRVPTVVAGPYVKQGYASSVVYDHTSVLKHIEVTHGLDPLNARVSAANDLSDLIDQERLATFDWAEPLALPPIELDYTAIDAACADMKARGSQEHPVLAWADANAARLGRMDRRRHTEGDLRMIAEYLDRHGAGRIRPRR
ncbi:MAG: phosphoesterase [Kofleriaceae bacterium]|jgi:phospholipase C|nr:phosphoesterase [Kofleriaceae bacterium]MBP9207175.1 phosphoesterase [Kofleriaceae bacterium]